MCRFLKVGQVYPVPPSLTPRRPCVVIRGRTDKKLTSTLVIQNFFSFELADIFLKYGSSLFFKKALKKV